VVLLIGLFSLRNFLLDRKNYRHLLLSAAFFLLGGSFLVKVLTNIMTHHTVGVSYYLSGLIIPNIIPSYSLLPALGFLVYASMTLFGFYILYALTSKEILTTDYVIIAYLIIIATYFARFNYHLLYVTGLLFLVAMTRRYYLTYKNKGYKNTLFLTISFGIITISQLVFIFTYSSEMLYAIAELIQLLGYLFLLYTFMMVLRNAKKTQ
jgi:hypothetical protein